MGKRIYRYLEGLTPRNDAGVVVVTGIQMDARCNEERVNAGYTWDQVWYGFASLVAT